MSSPDHTLPWLGWPREIAAWLMGKSIGLALLIALWSWHPLAGVLYLLVWVLG